MTLSALTLGISGISLLFFPDEIMHKLSGNNQYSIILQVIGALYFGFAMSNWTSKNSILGGIYGRAIVIGNLSHFMIGGILILKFYLKTTELIFLIASVIYFLFAISFGYLFRTHPKSAV
ncbi:hypothetical protein DCC35_06790 [Mangrovivirga cuniculi]|uniref:Uncharacterized protein n=2 Tax=Mangrovivirga cuniculi TaxID=2715131 RepID=A0A4D7K8G6_9BACT|nr:hypothetical protein DCC35_06790 [Mangrovivirga cuniculi]